MKTKAQLPEEQTDGEFQRQEDAFREWIRADGSSPYPAEKGRYHLYVSLACPWATRAAMVREIFGLQEEIGMTILDPVRDERGWAFRDGPGYSRDPINNFAFLSEAYRASDPDFRGRWTVPVLWDKTTHRIVNNSEDDICRMFDEVFRVRAKTPAASLFPEDLQHEQEELSHYIYHHVNNAVYEAGFATNQRTYELAVKKLFAALDRLEERLRTKRYLFGDRIVESDWRLFNTLVRFDPVYHGHFKCNLRRVVDYPNLYGYLKDLYQQPGIATLVNFDHIKRHYYVTHTEINPTQIVALGPLMDLSTPHGRNGGGELSRR